MLLRLYEIKDKTSLVFNWDYTNKIGEHDDILDIGPANVHMDLTHSPDMLVCQVHVTLDMVLACSKTLKPVSYHMDFEDEIIFGHDEKAEYPLTDPLPISDIVFGYILSQKPYTIYHPDAQKVLFEKEKSPHPAFADLDKILKK